MSTDELVPFDTGGTYHHQVVDLAGFRIEHGQRNRKISRCEHKNMTYSAQERQVWCRDCSRTIDNFDAFNTLARQFENMLREVQIKQREAAEALAKAARGRAVKTLDHEWSRKHPMAVACPHCRGGLLPEDFAGGATSAWSRDLEIAARTKKAKPT